MAPMEMAHTDTIKMIVFMFTYRLDVTKKIDRRTAIHLMPGHPGYRKTRMPD